MAVIRTQAKRSVYLAVLSKIKTQVGNLAFLLFGIACARVSIAGVISPFAPAMIAACCVSGYKQWQLAMGLGLGYLTMGVGLPIASLASCGVILSAGAALGRRYALSERTMFIIMTLTLSVSIAVFRADNIYTLLFGVIDIILAMIFYMAFTNMINVLKNSSGIILNDEQLIAAALCLCAPIIGLGNVSLLGCRFPYIVASVLSILTGYLCGGAGAVCGTLFGLAASFTTGDMLIIGNMAMGGLTAGMLRKLKLPVSALGFIVSNILMTVYINGEAGPILTLQEALAAAALVHLIPSKALIMAGRSLNGGIKRVSDEKYYLSRMKALAVDKLHDISGVFSQMAEMFLSAEGANQEAVPANASGSFMREQLFGTADVIDRLAGELDMDIHFREGAEEEVVRRLQGKGFSPCQVVAQDRNGKIELHIVLAAPDDVPLDEALIRECACKGVKEQMELKGSRKILGGERRAFIYRPKRMLTARIAHSQRAKQEVCGDSFADIRLADGRHILCLSDGMGFGERAAHESFCTVSLIHNLYKAGFGEDIIYKNINELLRLSAPEEMFSTVDICVMDLVRNTAVITKIGGVPSYLRRDSRLKAIGRESLPMGILEDVHSASIRHTLKDGDTIIMMTDGVWDRINRHQHNVLELNALLEHKSGAQAIADCVMDYALGIDIDTEDDDMTVVAADILGK